MAKSRKAVEYHDSRKLELRIGVIRKQKRVKLSVFSQRIGMSLERCRVIDEFFSVLTLRDVWLAGFALRVRPEDLFRDSLRTSGLGDTRVWVRRLEKAMSALMKTKAKAKISCARYLTRRDSRRLLSACKDKRLPLPVAPREIRNYFGPYHNIQEAYRSEAEKREAVRKIIAVPYSEIAPFLMPNYNLPLIQFQRIAEVFGQLSLAQLLRGKISEGDHGVAQRALLLRILRYLKAMIDECKKAEVDPAPLVPFEQNIVEHFGFSADAVQRFSSGSSPGGKIGRTLERQYPRDVFDL